MKLLEINAIDKEKRKAMLDEINTKKENEAMDYFNLGLINLSLKIYDAACKYLKKTIDLEFDFADGYYYLAVAYLKGNPPHDCNDTLIIKIEELINGAIMIKRSFKYYLFLAFINYDYYYRIGLKVWGGYEKYIAEAKKIGFEREDVIDFLKELNCEDNNFIGVIFDV